MIHLSRRVEVDELFAEVSGEAVKGVIVHEQRVPRQVEPERRFLVAGLADGFLVAADAEPHLGRTLLMAWPKQAAGEEVAGFLFR